MHAIQNVPLIYNVDINVRRQLSILIDTVQPEIRSDVWEGRVSCTITASSLVF